MSLRAVAVATVALAFALPAFGWGEKGHRIHAGLTWKLLRPETQERITRLLGTESFADAASWADVVRKDRKETAPWHYLNIAPGAVGFEAARDCADGQCVVTQVERWTAKLGDERAPAAERAEALRWVIHLVGDLHQPLHVALAADRGGNDITVRFFGDETNLHAVWDSGLIERFDHAVERHVAELGAGISAADRESFRAGSVTDWANESWRLANTVAYVGVDEKPIRAGAEIGRDYWLTRAAVVDRQLAKAAVRLAFVLDRALAGE